MSCVCACTYLSTNSMDPNESLSLAETIMNHRNAMDFRHNNIEILAAGPLQPIETDVDHAALFRRRDLRKDMVLSGINNDASVRFVATNLFRAKVEIRDLNVFIVRELLLCASTLTFINCRISVSNVGEDMINVCKGSTLKLVECEVNDCRIAVGTELTARAAAIWIGTAAIWMFEPRRVPQNFCFFSDCNFSYISPSMGLPFIEVLSHSKVRLNTCSFPNLIATDSSEIQINNCFFDHIWIAENSTVQLTNCHRKKTRANIPSENNVSLFEEGHGLFSNCHLKDLEIRLHSTAEITDSFVESALAFFSSKLKMERVIIASKTCSPLFIDAKSTLDARDVEIRQSQNDASLPILIRGSSKAHFNGKLNFVFGEHTPENCPGMVIQNSSVFFPEVTIEANLPPFFFVLAGSRVFYPEGTRLNIFGNEGNEFHRILKGSLIPGESKAMYISPRFTLPRKQVSNAGKPCRTLRIDRWGHLSRGSITRDDISEDDIAFTKSSTPSKAFLISRGIKINAKLNINSPLNRLNFKVYEDICPLCWEEEGCDTVMIPCGHVYHEDCYLSMISERKVDDCGICRSITRATYIGNRPFPSQNCWKVRRVAK
ncbi:MAG: hypothetical protein LBJ71_03280 [Holosporaceae bacterium]|nr:hypothetical protein [Holosporaceae bacterium]